MKFFVHIYEDREGMKSHICQGEGPCVVEQEIEAAGPFDTPEQAKEELPRVQADVSHDTASCEFCTAA